MKKNDFAVAFGRRLRQLRRLAGLTQAALAERSEVSLEHLNKIERGAASPSFTVLEGLHRALGVEPASLFLFDASEPAEGEAAETRPEAETVAPARLGVFALRPDTSLVRTAPSLLRLLGHAGRPRLGTVPEFVSAVFPQDAAAVGAALAGLETPGDRRLLAVSFLRRDGEVRPGSLALELVRDADARSKLIVGVLTDVSERVRQQRLACAEASRLDRRVRERSARLERITERLRRENAELVARERRYRGVFEACPLGIYFADADGGLIEANAALAALHGYASPGQMRRETKGRADRLFLDPASHAGLRQQLAAEGVVRDFEADARRRDGAAVPTQRDIRSVTEADGRLLYYEGFVRDSSALDNAAHDLRRYARMIAVTTDMVSLIDADGRYLFVNDAYLTAYARPRSEIIGRHIADFMGREFYEARIASHFEKCLAGNAVQFDQWASLPGLGRRYISVRLTPWTEDKGQQRVMAGIRDLTDTRLAEENLSDSERITSILYRVSSAVASEVDMDSLYRTIRNILSEALDTREFFIALVNRETDSLEFVHFVSAAQATLPPLTDLAKRLTPLTRDNITDYDEPDALVEILRTGHPLLVTRQGMHLTGLTCPGLQPEALLGVPIRVRQEVLGVMGLQHFSPLGGFTRKDAELLLSVAEQLALGVERWRNLDALRAAKEEADRANKAKSRFLASMSHEIRTPMNAILGLTDEVLRSELGPQQRDYLDTVRDSARHLLNILNDILDLSKIEARRMVLDATDFDPCELAGAVVKALGVAAAAKGLRLTLEVGPGLPEHVRGDAGKVRQILVNLVGNAVKFTAAGSVTLGIAPVRTSAGDANRLAFSVADTGIGIPPPLQEAIFDSFRQADDSIARHYGGTGLGLSISRELARLMGGELRVASTPGAGSTFVFSAPFAPAAAPSEASRCPAGPLVQPRRLRVLVAEDNMVNVKLMSIHLRKLGHTEVVAASGEEALRRLSEETFDLVLMDIEMPAMDGLTAARCIRAGGRADAPMRDPNVPIVAVTAHVSEDVRRACAEAGMNAYVGKPVNLEELAGAIARLTAPTAGSAPTEAPRSPTSARATGPEAVLDVEWALGRLGIERDVFGPILATSLTEFGKRLQAAEQALAAGDRAALRLHAHTLKSTAATMGARDCLRLAMALEAAANLPEAAGRTLHDLLDQLQQARQAAQAAADKS